MADWRFMLTDLHGVVLGELTNTSSRQVTLPLNRVPTASFQILANHYLAPYFMDNTWDGLLKCYRNNTLRFIGPIVSTNEAFDSNSQTIAVNAASPLWRLTYRLLGTSPTGFSYGNASTTYDMGFIAQQVLAAANAVEYTGISSGSTVASVNSSVGTWWYKDALTALGEMSVTNDSFDFECAPTEPTSVGQPWPQIGVFNVMPTLGTTKPNAIFEYGTSPGNVVSYGRQIDRTAMCTFGYIQQPAVSDYSGVLTSSDATAIAARGIFQALIDNGGVEWTVLRQAIADMNVQVRKVARQVVTFVPAPNSLIKPFDDYGVGDQVRARIIGPTGIVALDAMMRVWGITIAINDNGDEEPSLELIHP